jgi:hypothetical protein
VSNHLLKKVAERQGRGGFRLDKVTDGDQACGFAWTWTSGKEEGLRGTTFVQLNHQGEIQFVSEIPEPIYKPGDSDLTREMLKTISHGEEWKEAKPYDKTQPTVASELIQYLFMVAQTADPQNAARDRMPFFDDQCTYHDFNYATAFKGRAQIRQFLQDSSFPGIELRPLRIDDGVDSTCFTWELVLAADAPDTVKGISLYELDPVTRKIVHVRDATESAIKPPFVGKMARLQRPGIGVFTGVPLGSRPWGM